MKKYNEVIQPTFKKLTYLCMQTLTNFPFIEDDFDALTNYELLCKVVEYLNKVIANENKQNEDIQTLANAFNELKDYVDNYFDNLDVQEEINNKLDEMVEDGTFDEIINQTLFSEINNNIEKLNQFVTIEEFKTSDDVDDTNAFNLAVADGRPIYLLDTNYYVSDTITLNSQTRIYGKSMTESIINATHNDYVFEYITDVHDTGYDIKTNFELNNFKVICQNFIKINENNLEEANWITQGRLMHLTFKNLWIYGEYNTFTDNNKDTNVLPTLETLMGFGVGFNLNVIFDSIIENSRIENFGLGIYLKGCDLNTIENNRIHSNGCHIFLDRISTFGSQNRIVHNDILKNLRYGGIRVNGTCFDTIEDNYFETYTAAACEIYGTNERELCILNNRFDNPDQSDIDLIKLYPSNTDIISDNRINPAGANKHCYINVLLDNASNFINKMSFNTAVISNNNGKLEKRNNPLTINEDINKLMVSPYNVYYDYHRLSGARFVSPYFTLDETENLYYFLNDVSAGSSLKVKFVDLKKNYAKYPKLRFKYKSTESEVMYVKVTGDSDTLYNTNVTITADSSIHTVDLDLTANDTIYNEIQVELPVKATVELFSVELI